MATITKRARADGSFAYRATIRIKQGGKVVHSEAKTFDKLKLAQEWARTREAALAVPGALRKAGRSVTVGELLDWYLEHYGAGYGRSKLSSIKLVKQFDIAKLSAPHLTAVQLIDHIKHRRDTGTGPATAGNDLIWLRVVFKAARPALGLELNLQAIDDAAAFCRDQRLIAKARRRDRRPTDDELAILDNYFQRRDKRSQIPMRDIMWFAIHSSRRQEEITRLRWSDNHAEDLTGIVRDAKHPTAKEGNHRTFKYTREAWEIAQRQPRTDDRIFPYDSKSISSAFTKACHANEIEDLRFHDLRHEGVSRLFEAGYSLIEVQQFSLHESWSSLQRYTHIRPGDVKHRPSATRPSEPPHSSDPDI